MKLSTNNLLLRPLKMSDANCLVEGLNNLSITRWLFVVNYPYTLEDAQDWIKHTHLELSKKTIREYSFGIELKKEKKIIGGISLEINENYKGKIGYWINEEYWNKGYGSEALNVFLDFAFNKLKLKKLESGVFVGNIFSGKLLEKFGAKKEGLKRKSQVCKADGKIKDEFIYGLLKEDYVK